MKKKCDSFIPLMHDFEYKFILKYLNEEDILLEWGSGNSTLYFTDYVKKLISIEHDKKWFNKIKTIKDYYNIDNLDMYLIPSHSPTPYHSRYEQFKDYVDFPSKEKLYFTKVLVDGRARKYCANSIIDMIDDNVIVMIHDFNREHYQGVLKYYDIVDRLFIGEGIVALKKKS